MSDSGEKAKNAGKSIAKTAIKAKFKIVTLKVRLIGMAIMVAVMVVIFIVMTIIFAFAGSSAASAQANGAMINGIPPVVQSAINSAVAKINQKNPQCGVTVGLLTAIVAYESGLAPRDVTELSKSDDPNYYWRTADRQITTAPDGASRLVTLGPNGDYDYIIRAGQSNGGDRDSGVMDGSSSLDYALGPMQFMPTTFYGSPSGGGPIASDALPLLPQLPEGKVQPNGYGLDGNGDGIANINNLFDATISAANHLCSSTGGTKLSTNGVLDENATLAALQKYGGTTSLQARFELAKAYDNLYQAAAAAQQASGGAVTPGGQGDSPNGPIQLANVPGIGPMNAIAAPQASAMVAAAKASGVTLTGSSYRSNAAQIDLRRQHCGTGYYDIYQKPASSCKPPTAIPGRSQHEVGLAIDFNNCSHRSACFGWLKAHAAVYGFYNLPSESWHWSTTGK